MTNKTTPKTDFFLPKTRVAYSNAVHGTKKPILSLMANVGIDDGQSELNKAYINFERTMDTEQQHTLNEVTAATKLILSQITRALGFTQNATSVVMIDVPAELMTLIEANYQELKTLVETAQWGETNENLRTATNAILSHMTTEIERIKAMETVNVARLIALVETPVTIYGVFHMAMAIRNAETMIVEETTTDDGTEVTDQTVRETVGAGNTGN